MRKRILPSLFFLTFLLVATTHAQPGCPNVNAGTDVTLPCGTNCTTLTANAFPSGNTATYSVGSIPYTPFSYTAGTAVIVNDDDVWTSTLNLPFNFCFFGNSYNQLVVGANGLISFDLSNATQYCDWDLTAASPIPSTSVYTNSIMGPFHDIDPSQGGTIKYQIIGSFPCRIFVVSYYDIPMYDDIFLIGSCWGIDHATHQIALYETTNVIEMYTQRKETCIDWNDGLAIQGIQNASGTVAYTVPGRNLTNFDVTNDAWRFTPNGASIVSVEWLEGSNVIGTGNTVTVCPLNSATTYTAKATYLPCSGGTPVVVTDNVAVNLAGTLNASISSSTNVNCNGSNNGSATATVSGGNAPLTYGWSTGSHALSISGLAAGTYVFTATDASNCVRRDSVVITQPQPLSLSVPNVSVNNCSGTGTGSLSAIVSGGTPGYTYSWSSSAQTDSILDNVAAGTYNVTLTDAKGCTATQSGKLTISNTPINFGTPTIVSAKCSQGGSITTNVSGGVGNLSYTWSNTATTPGLSNTAAGSYGLTVTDQSGCSASVSYTIGSSANAVVLQTPTITNVQCNGGNNGSIAVSASGGTGTLNYTWGGGQTTSSLTGLTSGTYSVTVSDLSGCSASASYTLTQPNAIVVGNPVIVDATCSTGGSIATSVSGGSGSFAYLWSNGQTTATATNLSTGSYTVTYTDQTSHCTVTGNYNVGIIGVLPNIFVATPAPLSCTTLSQTITASSSTAGATFTWSTGATTSSISATTGGTYTVTALNPGSGCTASAAVVLSMDTLSPQLTTLTPAELNCLTATSTVGVNALNPGLTYVWNNGNTNQSFTVTTPGTFTVTATSALNGCSASAIVTVLQNTTPPNITIAPPADLNCLNATVTLNASSTSIGTTYAWSNGGISSSASVTSSGTYTVTATDPNNGCTATASTAVISNNTTPIVDAGRDTLLNAASITLTATSTGVVNYVWSTGDKNASTSVSAPGTYYVTAYDNNSGCAASDSVKVIPLTGYEIAIPTAFSPNGDHQNDLFFPIVRVGSGVTIKEFRVYNRWGELLHNNPINGWDGNFKNELQPIETYFYFVKYNVPQQGDENKTGSFSLLK